MRPESFRLWSASDEAMCPFGNSMSGPSLDPRDACMVSLPRQKDGFPTSCEQVAVQSERPFHLPIESKRCCVEASRCMSSTYS